MRLDDSDMLSLLGLWLRLASIDLRLSLLPHAWNREWIFGSGRAGSRSASKKAPELSAAETQKIKSLIARAASRPLFFNMSCLRQALALRDLLRAIYGAEARIKFGVDKKTRRPAAAFHAWVKIEGSDHSEPSYVEFK